MQAIILAGGKGLRLREVISDVPKPMAPMHGRPFLEHIILHLLRFSVKNIIVSVGYKGEKIQEYFGDGHKWGANISYSSEDEPLGTGGAVKRAESYVNESPFLVMNGDSYCATDISNFCQFHSAKGSMISIVVMRITNEGMYGKIVMNEEQRIMRFEEKVICRDAYVNAGIYLFDRSVFEHMLPECNFSLEYDFFPQLIASPIFGFETCDRFFDIGTPERYREASRAMNR